MAKVMVKSSNLKSLDYDKKRAILDIAFQNGSTYRYFDVSPTVYNMLKKAESVGSAFHKLIKNQFKTERVYTCLECEKVVEGFVPEKDCNGLVVNRPFCDQGCENTFFARD